MSPQECGRTGRQRRTTTLCAGHGIQASPAGTADVTSEQGAVISADRNQDREPSHLLHVGLRTRGDEFLEDRLQIRWTWEPAESPSTGLAVGRASSNGVNTSPRHRPSPPVRSGPAPRRTGANGALRRRSADGAVSRSHRAAVARLRSGVRPPAGTEPGNRAELWPPAGLGCRWSNGASRSGSLSSRPGGTGPSCSANSPGSWTTPASMTATRPASVEHCSPY